MKMMEVILRRYHQWLEAGPLERLAIEVPRMVLTIGRGRDSVYGPTCIVLVVDGPSKQPEGGADIYAPIGGWCNSFSDPEDLPAGRCG